MSYAFQQNAGTACTVFVFCFHYKRNFPVTIIGKIDR